MKTKWMAILNAGGLMIGFHPLKRLSSMLIISIIIINISCDNSDDLEPFIYESPLEKETPSDYEPPVKNKPPQDNESPTDDEPNIIYTDIEPDLTSENIKDFYNLDLNNDQIIDFTLSLFNDTLEDWLLISSHSHKNNGIMSASPWYTHPIVLDSGKEIFNLRWYRDGEFYEYWSVFNIGRCFGGDPVCSYDWKDKIDKFVGLHFFIKGNSHYGWARMEVSSPTQWVIKDYAYNATPNSPILAGQLE